MPFEKYENQGQRTGSPMISIRKSASIGINSAALSEYFDEEDEHAEIYYDDEENRVGLRPLSEPSDASYSLTRTESGAALVPSSFLKSHNLIPEVTTQYKPQIVEADGVDLVTINIDDPIGTYGSPDEE